MNGSFLYVFLVGKQSKLKKLSFASPYWIMLMKLLLPTSNSSVASSMFTITLVMFIAISWFMVIEFVSIFT
jgi:hypothetical protein